MAKNYIDNKFTFYCKDDKTKKALNKLRDKDIKMLSETLCHLVDQVFENVEGEDIELLSRLDIRRLVYTFQSQATQIQTLRREPVEKHRKKEIIQEVKEEPKPIKDMIKTVDVDEPPQMVEKVQSVEVKEESKLPKETNITNSNDAVSNFKKFAKKSY